MKEVIVDIGQNLCDICLQETGSMDLIFEIAEENGINPYEELTPGQSLTISINPSKPRIVKYLKSKVQTVTSE